VEAKVEAKRGRRDPEGKREKPIAIIMDLHSLMSEIWRQKERPIATEFTVELWNDHPNWSRWEFSDYKWNLWGFDPGVEDWHSTREQIIELRCIRARIAQTSRTVAIPQKEFEYLEPKLTRRIVASEPWKFTFDQIWPKPWNPCCLRDSASSEFTSSTH
jgi:hypothetical protein